MTALPPAKPFEVSHKSVIAIALPTTFAYLSTPIIGLVDTGVVGRLGDAAMLGGLAMGAILFDIVFTTFNFMRASTTALVAQAQGSGDEDGQRIVLIRALMLSLLLGLVTWIFSPAILRLGTWAMDPSQGVLQAMSAYFVIRIVAAPLTLINYTVLGWMLGQARAGLGLVLQTVLNGTNILLSIYLGLHLGWGIEGVAWATVIAEAVAALLGLTISWKRYQGSGFPGWARILNTSAMIRLMSVNRDIMIRSFALLFAFAFFTAQGAKLGDTALAANAVLMNFFLISGYLLDGFATAAEQLAGKAIGARYRQGFVRAVNLTLIWGFILASLATALFWFAGPWLIDLLTTNEEVRQTARVYLIWAAMTALVGVAAFQMDGVYIGATWSAEMRNMMLLSLAAYLLVWWLAVPVIGNHGLWLALNVFLGVRGITLLGRLRGNIARTFVQG